MDTGSSGSDKKTARRWQRLAVALLIAGVLGPLQAAAMTITYTVTNISGNRYQYDYTVNNNAPSVSPAVEWIYILFANTPIDLQPDGIPDHTIYENLAVTASPANWDLLVLPPGADDGVLDALALPGPGIAPGSSLGGFSVAFDWWGPGTPGAQPFAIWATNATTTLPPDCSHTSPVGSDPLACGMTAAAIPTPAAIWLFTSALAGLGVLRRRWNEART